MLAASRLATPPSVNLTAPASGASFGAPATINLAADVVTNGHSITQVQFYNGPSLLGQSSSPPYAFTWSGVPAGQYTLLAQVVYDSGATAFSAPAFVTVVPIPSAPATITPLVLANNLINVSWPAAADATGYILSRDGAPVAWGTATNYMDLGLSPGTAYCYSVVATNAFGSSPSSITNCATTSGAAAALAWDPGGASGPQDGNGNWGATGASWWNGSAAVGWANNSLAMFGAGTSTNCSVVITNDVTPSGVIFNANSGGTYNISSASGALNLSGTPTITANDNATINAYLKGGGLLKAGPASLTFTVANTNTGAITVNAGALVSTVSCWYTPRGIGSGLLTINSGALAEFTATHGFGASASGQSATINGGTLQFDRENYVSGLNMTAGSVVGSGELRTVGGVTYTVNASTSPSVLGLTLNFVGAPTFNVARGSRTVDLLVTGNGYNTAGFTKSGSGLMRCTGNVTNSGPVTVSAGTLQVDGLLGTSTATLTIQNTATLAGVGIINGPTTIQSGGTLAPGDGGIGTLSFSNSVTLNAGSKAFFEVMKSGNAPSNDLVTTSGTLTFAGSLVVTNIGTNAFTEGDTCQLFSARAFAGAFTGFTLPALAANLTWDATKVATNGTITVVALPTITGVAMLPNGSFALSGIGGAGETYTLLTASNLVPPVQWAPGATNTADASGYFDFNDPEATNYAQRYYRVLAQ